MLARSSAAGGLATRKISRTTANCDPHAIWNAYVHFLATSSFEDLDEIQRPAFLTFWYHNEVQNGGHLQFFLNHRADQVQSTVGSLVALGAIEHARILGEALMRWNAVDRDQPRSVDGYVEVAQLAEFQDLDAACFAMEPPLTAHLQAYLSSNQPRFVVVED